MVAILPRKWQVFLITYIAYSVVYITRKSFSVVKTLIQDDLGLSRYALGTIDSVFLGTYAIFQLFLPAVSDAVGVRPVLLIALWSASFFALTFSVSYSPTALVYSWLFEGIAHAPIFSVLIKVVTLWFPPAERAKVLGVWTTSQQVGAMVATTLATFISSTFGWRAAFTTAAIVTAGTAVIVQSTLPEPPTIPLTNETAMVELPTVPRRSKSKTFSTDFSLPKDDTSSQVDVELGDSTRHHSNSRDNSAVDRVSARGNSVNSSTSPSACESPAEPTFTPPATPMMFFDVLRVPNLISCGMAYFCVKLVRYALLFWLPYFLITELKFGTSLAGYSSMMFDVGGIFGAIASGFLADKLFRGKRLTTAAVMCVATAFALLLFAHSASKNGEPPFAEDPALVGGLVGEVSQPDFSVGGLNVTANATSITAQVIDIPHNMSMFLAGHPRHLSAVADELPENFVTTLVLMTLVGFFIAGPDSILGAASAAEVCERSGSPSAQAALSTATGIVNGLGAFGGVAQGYLTAWISETWGWSVMFLVLCAASLGSVLALFRCILDDWKGTPRYTSVQKNSTD